MMRWPLILLLCFVAPAAFAVEVIPVELKYESSIIPTEDLEAGDTVVLIIDKADIAETIRLHLCGPQCQTATTMRTWSTQLTQVEKTYGYQVERPGHYYMWVEEPDGSVATPTESKQCNDALCLKFPSGLGMTVAVIRP